MTNRAKIEEIKHLISEYDKNLNREQEAFSNEIEMYRMASTIPNCKEYVFPKEPSITQKDTVVESLLFRIEAVLETPIPEEKV